MGCPVVLNLTKAFKVASGGVERMVMKAAYNGADQTLPEIERVDMGSLSAMYRVKSALLTRARMAFDAR